MTTTPIADHPPVRALVRTRYGSADVLEIVAVPRPTVPEDRVLVRVEAASVDRGAWHLMTGLPYAVRPVYGIRRPRAATFGTDVAGVVEEVGPKVQGLAPGDEVYGIAAGAFAEYALARPNHLARRPANLTPAEAATVPVSGLTALQAVRDRARVERGQRVLVLGASGGVGTFAVQLAKAAGAHVTGVCRTSKVDLVRALGADEVVEYTVGEPVGSFDAVLDAGGNRPLRALRRLLTPRGALVIIGGEGGGRWLGGFQRGFLASARSIATRQRLGTFVAVTRTADLDVLREMIEGGLVHPVVDRVCGLDGIADAMRDLEAGRVRGKVAVDVAGPDRHEP